MSEEQDYISLKDAAAQMEIKRASIYYYINKLGVEPVQFVNNKHSYLTQQDFEQLKALKDQPWKISPQKPKRGKKDKAVA